MRAHAGHHRARNQVPVPPHDRCTPSRFQACEATVSPSGGFRVRGRCASRFAPRPLWTKSLQSDVNNSPSASACCRAHPYCRQSRLEGLTEQLSLEGGPCVGGVRRREQEPGGTHPCMRQERTHRQVAGHFFGVGGQRFSVCEAGESFACSVQGGEQVTRRRGSVLGANVLRMEFFLRSCEKFCIARDQELLVPSHTPAEVSKSEGEN